VRQVLYYLRQQRRIEDLIRRIPILGLTPHPNRRRHAQGGEDKLLEVWPLILTAGIGREELHGDGVIEAIMDAPHRIIRKGLCGYRIAQEELGVLVSEKPFQAVEGTPAT